MQPKHITFRVEDERDEAVFADGHLRTLNTATGCRHPALLDGAILATEVDEGAVTAGAHAFHLDQGTGGAIAVFGHRESEELDAGEGCVQCLQLGRENRLIKLFGPLKIFYIYFKPTGFVFICLSPSMMRVQEKGSISSWSTSWHICPLHKSQNCRFAVLRPGDGILPYLLTDVYPDA
jgi:hypothetical protein